MKPLSQNGLAIEIAVHLAIGFDCEFCKLHIANVLVVRVHRVVEFAFQVDQRFTRFEPQRDKIERLARYVSRPPVATDRLSLTQGGNVRYALKTPYRDGTTHVIFEPEDFIARLAALVPKPRAHLTRYHGVFAPASPNRAKIVPGTRTAACAARDEGSVSDRQRAMSWAQRLKRVFAIDIETCRQCGGKLRVIASIEEPAVIERILEHLGRDAETVDPAHPSRAPPQGDRLV